VFVRGLESAIGGIACLGNCNSLFIASFCIMGKDSCFAVRIKCMVEAAEVQNLHETCIRKDIKSHNLNLQMGILRISVTGIPDDKFQRAEAYS